MSSPPSKRVKHDRESDLLQSLQAINVGVQQAFELITIIQQYVHIDNNSPPSFIPGIHLVSPFRSHFCFYFSFPSLYLPFFPFNLFCCISASHNLIYLTQIPEDASPKILARHVGNEVMRLNEQLQAIVKHITDLQPHPKASDSPHVYISPSCFFSSIFSLLFLFFPLSIPLHCW